MLIAAVVAAATLASHAIGPQASASGIQMRTVRFWLPEVKKTSVMATVEVPYALTTPIGTGPSAFISYLVIIRVRNEKGGTLNAEQWYRHAPAIMRSEKAAGMESLSFGVVPGKYWLEVEVVDSTTNRSVKDSVRFDGYSDSPGASDLLLASQMRRIPEGDTTTEVGELARGNFRFVTAPSPHIVITQPQMGFLMEAYTPDAGTATLALKVATADGNDLVPLIPTERQLPAGGGIIANEFSLEGLPAGQYILKASLTMKGKTVEREAPFAVNAVEAALAQNVADVNANKGLDEVYFNSLPEDSLDAAAEVLELVPGATTRERGAYKKDELSLRAKRQFLIEFWAKRDANKATAINETRIAFYQAVGYANAHYGARFVPGWKTARGRVYAKYGAPDDSLNSSMGGMGIRTQVWKMTRGKLRWFIFGDRANNGSYVLLKSSEVDEPGVPDWYTMVTAQPASDIAIFLGFRADYFRTNQ
jgi:GWxTD domain-containing protein